MGDRRASIKIEFSMHGQTKKADMWINWSPSDYDGIDLNALATHTAHTTGLPYAHSLDKKRVFDAIALELFNHIKTLLPVPQDDRVNAQLRDLVRSEMAGYWPGFHDLRLEIGIRLLLNS